MHNIILALCGAVFVAFAIGGMWPLLVFRRPRKRYEGPEAFVVVAGLRDGPKVYPADTIDIAIPPIRFPKPYSPEDGIVMSAEPDKNHRLVLTDYGWVSEELTRPREHFFNP